jgi:hypothetical protein
VFFGAYKPSYLQLSVAGASAAALESLILVPTDVIKIRLQNQTLPAPGQPLPYAGSLHCAKMILRKEGLSNGFFLGSSATVMRQLVYGATLFPTFEYLRRRLTRDGEQLVGFRKLLCGIGAGVSAAVVGAPFDLAKTRIQASGKGVLSLYRSMESVLEREGLRALWKGGWAKTLRIGIGTGVHLVAYETLVVAFLRSAP